MLHRDIGNVPIQFDLQEILSMYVYQIHTCDSIDLMGLIGNVPAFKWLARRWQTVADNVDLVSSFAGHSRMNDHCKRKSGKCIFHTMAG